MLYHNKNFHEDTLFLLLQILEDKFLVAFGPCKHGKYRETTYQDTFVFDIVDYCDAQRHTIVTGDHVLAPWEPEGERYGPGIVIDGQEKRQAIGEWIIALVLCWHRSLVECLSSWGFVRLC